MPEEVKCPYWGKTETPTKKLFFNAEEASLVT
jgi:hypothetical protein